MQRVMKIIEMLIAEVLSDTEETLNGPEIVAMLLREGYDADEIEQALSLIFSLPDAIQARSEEVVYPAWQDSMRVFTPEERVKLDVEAQGYLLGLLGANLIDQSELEDILGEVAALQLSQVGIPEVQWIVGRVVDDDVRSFLLSTAPLYSSDEEAGIRWN
ncbi:MAG: DUF494 domain-containing protein [Firmicutes bacterium]|jgi:Smg protein|nr:DUF494 domain-containing protein [Bacillota bacterium]